MSGLSGLRNFSECPQTVPCAGVRAGELRDQPHQPQLCSGLDVPKRTLSRRSQFGARRQFPLRPRSPGPAAPLHPHRPHLLGRPVHQGPHPGRYYVLKYSNNFPGLQELYENFYYIWAKLKNGDAECKDVEWKRRMHFVLDQLKSGKTLTTR